MACADFADNAAMDNNTFNVAVVFLLAVFFCLYIMRRRSRLGKRTPRF